MAQYEHITIDGSPAFIAATQRALGLLRATPSWRLAQALTRIREQQTEISNAIGGYVWGTEFTVSACTWKGGAKYYASQIAHEGCHATHGHSSSAESERVAFAAQAQALRELGASWSEIAYCEKHGRNPTHHVQWETDWNAQFGQGTSAPLSPSTAAVSPPIAQAERPMGAIERMAHAYHAHQKKGWFS